MKALHKQAREIGCGIGTTTCARRVTSLGPSESYLGWRCSCGDKSFPKVGIDIVLKSRAGKTVHEYPALNIEY